MTTRNGSTITLIRQALVWVDTPNALNASGPEWQQLAAYRRDMRQGFQALGVPCIAVIPPGTLFPPELVEAVRRANSWSEKESDKTFKGKAPVTGVEKASSHPARFEVLAQWACRERLTGLGLDFDDLNWGIAAGFANSTRIVGLDVDDRDGALRLIEAFNLWDSLFAITQTRNGAHLLFIDPENRWADVADRTRYPITLPSGGVVMVDVRSKTLMVGPGSVHEFGAVYVGRWLNPAAEEPSAALLDALPKQSAARVARRAAQPAGIRTRTSKPNGFVNEFVERFEDLPGLSPEELLGRVDMVPYVQGVVEGEYERIRDAEEGKRHESLLFAGKNLGELALCGWLGAEDIARLAIAAMDEEQHGWASAEPGGRADRLRALACGMAFAKEEMIYSLHEPVWVASHIHRTADWRSRNGDTLNRLLGVLIQASLAHGIDTISMDMRTMAHFLGFQDHSSVQRHIKRLVMDGWIEVVSVRPGHPQAAVYKLGERLRQLSHQPQEANRRKDTTNLMEGREPVGTEAVSVPTPHHHHHPARGLCSFCGLLDQHVEAALEDDLQQALDRTSGPVDSRILRANRTTRSTLEQLMVLGETSAEELARATGKATRAIDAHLKQLIKDGLAEKVRHGRYQATPDQVDPVVTEHAEQVDQQRAQKITIKRGLFAEGRSKALDELRNAGSNCPRWAGLGKRPWVPLGDSRWVVPETGEIVGWDGQPASPSPTHAGIQLPGPPVPQPAPKPSAPPPQPPSPAKPKGSNDGAIAFMAALQCLRASPTVR